MLIFVYIRTTLALLQPNKKYPFSMYDLKIITKYLPIAMSHNFNMRILTLLSPWTLQYFYNPSSKADVSTLTVSPCGKRFNCLSHSLTLASSFLTVLQILSGFFPKLLVLSKNKHRQHIPMLLKDAFLIWLTKTNQAVAVLCLWDGRYCSLC